ncbi:TPA: hypothetical protein SL738_006412 [Pseudomonas aeruginosa]|nr:hypothetical protein [Pseudomonas aeruginosa]
MKSCLEDGLDTHLLRVSLTVDGKVQFYIHPEGEEEEAVDFEVDGSTLTHVTD